MPLNGVNVKDLRNWLGPQSLRVVKNLENRSWVVSSYDGIALHPIIRDVIRHELPVKVEDIEGVFADLQKLAAGEKKFEQYPYLGLRE